MGMKRDREIYIQGNPGPIILDRGNYARREEERVMETVIKG
jgi:hypothetical protein